MNARTSCSVHRDRNMPSRRSARRRVSKRSCSWRDVGRYGSTMGDIIHPWCRQASRQVGAWRRPAARYHPRPMSDISRVGVVGGGLMGSGIAEVCARAGLDVVVREVDAGAAEAGQQRLTTSLDRGVRSGKLTEDARDAALAQRHVHHRPRRARRPPARRRGGRRGRDGEGRRVPRPRRGRHRPGRDPRQQHQLDPDHEAGHRHLAARAGDRHPLLQPRAGAAPRRAGDQPADRRRRPIARPSASPPTSSASGSSAARTAPGSWSTPC